MRKSFAALLLVALSVMPVNTSRLLPPNPVTLLQLSDTIEPGVQFSIAADYVASPTAPEDGLRLYRDNVVLQTLPAGSAVNEVVTFPPFTGGLPAGVYVFQVSAFRTVDGQDLESRSGPLTLTVNTTQQAQCQDTVDNDGDSLVDYPADPGCASATDNDETNIATQCTFQFSRTSVGGVPASGGSDQVGLTASDASCQWTSTADVSWLSTTPPSGTGSIGMSYNVAANTGPQRTGVITIGNATLTVTQVGTVQPCTYTITPTSSTVPAAGGTGSVTVGASASTCQWTAVANATWLTVGAGGTGNGTLSYTIQANTTQAQRVGTLTVADLQFTVTQSGASAPGTVVLVRNQCTPVIGADRSPDGTTSGWTAHFRFVNANGTFTEFASDNTSPYQRSTPQNSPLQPGTYRIDISWTKSGVAPVVYAPLTVVCQ